MASTNGAVAVPALSRCLAGDRTRALSQGSQWYGSRATETVVTSGPAAFAEERGESLPLRKVRVTRCISELEPMRNYGVMITATAKIEYEAPFHKGTVMEYDRT